MPQGRYDATDEASAIGKHETPKKLAVEDRASRHRAPSSRKAGFALEND